MESSILQLKHEDLLHFVISDLNKSSFFQNCKVKYIKDNYKKIKIKDFLIKNLESEYKHDNDEIESEKEKEREKEREKEKLRKSI